MSLPQRGYGDAWGRTVFLYQGARCVVTGKGRTAAQNNWRSYNVLSVAVVDDANRVMRVEHLPAGKFNAGARATGEIVQIAPSALTD